LTSLGHPRTFQRVSRRVTALHSSSGRQPNFTAFNRGRHLYSAARPSRWALARILVKHSDFHAAIKQFIIVLTIDKCTHIEYTSSSVAEMGDRGHNRHGPKEGAAVPISERELSPRLTQCGLGRGLLPYNVASSSIQPFSRNRHGLKTGGCAFVPLDKQ